jgi:hypothetical protein
MRAARRPRELRRASLAAAVLLCLAAGCGDKSGDDSGGTATEAGNNSESDQGLTGTDNQGTGDNSTGDQGTGDQNTGDQNTGDQNTGGDALGAPKPRKGGGARGAPIRIPAQQNDQGKPLTEEIAFIRKTVRERCGGTECVHWRVVYRSEGTFDKCHFVRTEPAQDTPIKRGSTFLVVAGTEPCDDSDGSGTGDGATSPSADPGGDQSGGQNGDQPDSSPSS